MIEQLRQNPDFAIVLGFYLVAACAFLCGVAFIVRDILNSRWRKNYLAMKEQAEARRLRLAQLGEQLGGRPIGE